MAFDHIYDTIKIKSGAGIEFKDLEVGASFICDTDYYRKSSNQHLVQGTLLVKTSSTSAQTLAGEVIPGDLRFYDVIRITGLPPISV